VCGAELPAERPSGVLFCSDDYLRFSFPAINQEEVAMLNLLKARFVLVALLTVIVACPSGSSARTIEGVYFTPQIMASDVPMVLNGVGLKRVYAVVKVSVAALYLGEGVNPSRVLTDVPKRLEIEYFHAISAQDFVKLTRKLLKKNVDKATLKNLRPRIDRLNTLYRDVKPGDRYALTYLPGRGTALALNGTEIGVIEGEDFSAAVFSMWLGPRPLSNSLKGELLGQG
jgi:hypothetical protein